MRPRRTYFLSFIRWDDRAGRGFDASHSFEAATDAEARSIADAHMRGVRTSGAVYLRVLEQRVVPYEVGR